MPRFHFHVHDGGLLIEDAVGSEFSSIDDAISEAFTGIRFLAEGLIASGIAIDEHVLQVADNDGRIHQLIRFIDVVDGFSCGKDPLRGASS